MRNPRRDSPLRSVNRIMLGGMAVSLLTSVHHHYGANVYETPRYELPDDAFFEVTGVLQVVPAAITGYYLYRAVQERRSGVGAAGNLTAA